MDDRYGMFGHHKIDKKRAKTEIRMTANKCSIINSWRASDSDLIYALPICHSAWQKTTENKAVLMVERVSHLNGVSSQKVTGAQFCFVYGGRAETSYTVRPNIVIDPTIFVNVNVWYYWEQETLVCNFKYTPWCWMETCSCWYETILTQVISSWPCTCSATLITHSEIKACIELMYCKIT